MPIYVCPDSKDLLSGRIARRDLGEDRRAMFLPQHFSLESLLQEKEIHEEHDETQRASVSVKLHELRGFIGLA